MHITHTPSSARPNPPVYPSTFLHNQTRSSIRRCFIAQNHIYFADVVFADVFTSFAKVLGDVWLSLCILMPGASLLAPPAQIGLARWILPSIMR